MDTNNNSAINNQGQNVQTLSNPVGNNYQEPTQYHDPNMPKGKSGRTVIILVVLLILVIAIGVFLFFVNSMGNKTEVTPTVTVRPSPTPVPPTPTPNEEFYIEDPEIDLKALDASSSSL